MNLEAGQRVLCINDYRMRFCAYPIKKGLVYTIAGFYKCQCGSDQVTLLEIPFTINMACRCEKISFRRQSYFIWRFIPLDYFEKFIDLSVERKEPPRKIKILSRKQKEEELKESSILQNW